MSFLWTAFVALGAVSAFLLLVVAVRRWPVIGAATLAAQILVMWEFPAPIAVAQVSATSIYFPDLLSSCFILIIILDAKRLLMNVGPVAIFWVLFGCMLAMSLVLGVLQFGPNGALNEFRMLFYPFATVTWAMTLDWNNKLQKSIINKLSLALGWGLVILATYHVSRYGLGETSEFVDAVTGYAQTSRPLVSEQTLILLLCAVVVFWRWSHERKSSLLISGMAFLTIVAIVQQRTVWAVGIVVVCVVFLMSRSNTRHTILKSAAIVAWGIAMLSLSGRLSTITAQLDSAASNFGTYDYRVNSWIDLIHRSFADGPGVVAVGAPFGHGFGRYEGVGRWVEFAPHNWYLTIYLRVGIVGLTLFLLFFGFLFGRVLRARANLAATAVITAMVIYGWTYSWPWVTAVFVGWAVCTIPGSNAAAQERVPDRSSAGTRRELRERVAASG